MPDIPTWAELWELEPELRPRSKPGERETLGCDLHYSEKRGFFWQGSWGPSDPLFPSVAADLCAMRAVRFLIRNSVLISGPHDCDGMYHVDTTDGISKALRSKSTDLDAALRAACKAVVEGRKG